MNSLSNSKNLSETNAKLPPEYSKHAFRGQQNRSFYDPECSHFTKILGQVMKMSRVAPCV